MASPRNPLQEQLLKVGLAKKSRVNQIAREQAKKREGASTGTVSAEQVDANRLRQEMAERDRALAAERNAQLRAQEARAQARQIVEQGRLPPEGEIEYRFTHAGAIRSVLVTDAVRRQLAKGVLVIVCHEASYAIVPRAAAEKISARDASMIALDHRDSPPSGQSSDDDDGYYARFVVPDDLVW